ncbi:DUF4097 family beta strand repeat-containing protein [Aestuariimicrobium ganziense]|uniref:DUF4097 family beta strand repeat-containing protein n=1 Tax=Aestuariimicrobium ganziense TaxID=2773677 RepID=UPI0019419E65|nr:DUF4097 family beta strand repeat-containing protein [Aestuariimicrobium ganziense]
MTDTTSIVRTTAVDAPVRVRIRNARGDVAVQAVEGLTEARAELRSRGPVDLDPFAPEFRDGELHIDVPALLDAEGAPGFSFSIGRHSFSFGSNQPEVLVVVHVPTNSPVHAETKSGDISLDGRFAEVELSTGQGDISVTEAARAKCSTGSGDVSLRRIDGDADLNTGSGDISVADNTGRMKATTGSGDIDVHAVHGEGKLSTGSGDVSVDLVEGTVRLSSGSGDFSVRELGSGSVEAKTASGDISIGVRGGIPVWTDCSSMTGDVDSSLRGAGEPSEGQPHIEIRATTVSGDISLTEV